MKIRTFRICEHCNKEYEVDRLSFTPVFKGNKYKTSATHNMGDCPHCGKRDDVWIQIKVEQSKAITKLEKIVEDKDFFPFKYIGGGYFRQTGVPKKVKAEIIHAPEAIEYVKNKFKQILNELNKAGEK